MTKIKFGDQHNDSFARHQIVSDGGDSEIAFGNQYDRSRLATKILDLRDPADLTMIAGELTALIRKVRDTSEGRAHPEDVKALELAAKQASAGDADGTKATLKKVGKWVVSTATAIATPVVVELLKSVVGL